MQQRLAIAFLIVAATAGTAAAQNREPADRVHDPLTMDRFTPVSTFGIDLGYEVWDSDDPVIDTAIALQVGGHFVSSTGAGGYFALPLSYIATPDIVVGGTVIQEGDSEVALGNIEVGGLYASPLGPNADLVVHGGLALPTADDDGVGALQFAAALPHWTDLVQRWPNSTWLRLGVSPMGRSSIVFWRADVGIDLMIDDDDNQAADISPIIRVNVGGGVDLGTADLIAELNTNIADDDTADDDDSASSLALGARFDSGSAQPGLALVLPVGFDGNENLDFAILVSVAARMQ